MTEGFPEDVRQFIAENIDSVAVLEVLLLLKNDAQRVWHPEEISKTLYTTSEMVTAQLNDLQARGLAALRASPEPRYQYEAGDPQREKLIERLAELYQQRRVSVITTIYSKPVDRVRTFADAFRFRRDR